MGLKGTNFSARDVSVIQPPQLPDQALKLESLLRELQGNKQPTTDIQLSSEKHAHTSSCYYCVHSCQGSGI